MVSLYDSEIKDILPEVLAKTPEVKALSYAINRAIRKLLDHCEAVGVYANIDKQSDEVLDLMAIELDALYYDMSLPLANKRKIIKDTIPQYLRSGTAGAVEDLITSIFGGGEVEEWFDYGGTPGHFRLFVDITDSENNPVYDMNVNQMAEKLERVKKYSQHLDGFTWMYKKALVIKEKHSEYVYTNPACGTFKCGTYPKQSTLGWSVGNGLMVKNSMDISVYTNPVCGTFPETASLGWSENLKLGTQSKIEETVYENVPCGTKDCGTMPKIKTLGYSEIREIDVNHPGNKLIVTSVNNPPVCGVLICGENI